MAASRPPGQWVRAVLYANGDQKEWSMDFWYTLGGGPIPLVDFPSVSADIINALQATFSGLISHEVTFRGAYVEFSDGATVIGYDRYQDFAGTVSQPPMPFDVAVVVTKFGLQVGRSVRGRIYVAGVPETFGDGSYLTVAGQVAFESAIPNFQADITSGAHVLHPAHYSRKLNSITRTQGWDIVALLATRRRRRGPF